MALLADQNMKKIRQFQEYIVSSYGNQHVFLLLLVGRWTTTS